MSAYAIVSKSARPLVFCGALMATVVVPPAGLLRAQDRPEQELGLPPPPLPLPEDPEAGLVEGPVEEKPSASEPVVEPPAEETSASRSGRFYSTSSYPDSGVRGGQQTQVLARGVMRIEAGPPDFALRDSGYLAAGRGLRIGRADHGNTSNPYAGLGLGLSYGVLENLEIGILQLPVIFANGYGKADFGNIQIHGRYGILKKGPVELGAQLVLQVPSNRSYGVGLGIPVRIFATDDLIIDSGVELEIVTYVPGVGNANTIVNLDVPIAVNYYVTPKAFVGGRFGMFVWNFDHVFVPLGAQGGYLFRDGMVHLMGWFQWSAIPLSEFRYSTKALNVGSFEFGIGANIFLGFPRGGRGG